MRLLLLAALLVASLPGYATPIRPDFNPVIGQSLDLTLPVMDEIGHSGPLAGFMRAKPALLLFGYDRCPNLCGVAQRDLAEALGSTDLPAGSYTVFFVSIDSSETSADAEAARGKLQEALPSANLSAWRFITANDSTISSLESAVGVTVRPVDRNLYVHPVAIAAVTGTGRLSRVLFGLDYAPRDLRLAIIEASENRLGSLGDRILLLCSGFDAARGHYTSAIILGVRGAGVAGIAALAAAILLMIRRGRA